MNLTAIVSLVGVLGGSLGGFLIAYRKLSGRIGTSEASKLWDEATAMRAEYREQAERMQQIIDRLRERIVALEAENITLRAQLRETA